jgi:hypothetical protein
MRVYRRLVSAFFSLSVPPLTYVFKVHTIRRMGIRIVSLRREINRVLYRGPMWESWECCLDRGLDCDLNYMMANFLWFQRSRLDFLSLAESIWDPRVIHEFDLVDDES